MVYNFLRYDLRMHLLVLPSTYNTIKDPHWQDEFMMYDFFMYGLRMHLKVLPFIYNTIKDPHWYAVQGSDTTMMTRAASLPGQKLFE